MACGHSTMLPAHRTGRRPSVVDSARSAPSRGLIAVLEAVAAEADEEESVSNMVVDAVTLVAVWRAACSDVPRVAFDAPVLVVDSSTGGLSTML